MTHVPKRRLAVCAVLCVAVLGCGGPTGITDSAALTDALARAASGDEIRLGRARFVGAFVVPAGVTLIGEGEGTVFVPPTGQPALALTGGDPSTTVAALRIDVDGGLGILANGGGGVALRDLTVTVAAGVGIGAEDLTTLAMRDVTVDGAVTQESASSLPLAPSLTEAPTYGVVLVRVASAQLQSLAVDGFGIAGVVSVDGGTVWSGGASEGTRGTALFVYGGSAEVSDVGLCGVIQGGGLVPSYGAVFSGGADVRTTRLEVCDGEGYGIVQSDSRGTHSDLTVRNMSEAGVWVQRSDRFSLEGTASELSGNLIAGLFVADSSNVTIADAAISNTRLGTRITAEGPIMVGDGVQLIGTTRAVVIRNLRLADNERVGLLLDVGTGTTADCALSGVTVTASGTALGVIAQGSTIEAGWDDGVTRAGAAVMNDPAFAGVLDPAGVVSPTDLPDADTLRSMGLVAVIGG